MLTLGLDRAQIYVNVLMDPNLWKELFVAQCEPELRKQYNHPNDLSKEGTKIWLKKWVIWHMVEASVVSILTTIMGQFHPNFKKNKLGDEAKAYLEVVLKFFMDYASKVRQKYFMQIWALKKDKKAPPMSGMSFHAKRWFIVSLSHKTKKIS